MYQSPTVIQDAALTPADSESLVTANGLLIEKWELMYPEVEYRQIDFLPTAAVDAGQAQIVGTLPGTVIDPLTGESIPLDANDEFVQPHGDDPDADAVDATVTRQFKDAVLLPTFFRRQQVSRRLKATGENTSRHFQVMWPTALLDRFGVVVNVGDEFEYAGRTVEIKEAIIPDRGYWKWTNIPMYVVAWCSYKSKGS